MKTYIACKIVKAESMTKDGKEGYKVVYPDGYESWCPKDVFEEANLEYGVKGSELLETIKPMMSADYKERFKAEYWQLKIRYEKLHAMVIKHEAGTLPFTPTCNIELLKNQKSFMGQYLYCLEVRAAIEGVELPEVEI